MIQKREFQIPFGSGFYDFNKVDNSLLRNLFILITARKKVHLKTCSHISEPKLII